jgi:hypothetical protein
MKRFGRNESIWVVIHTCMKTTQRISLYSYLYLKLAKITHFSYYRLCFFLLQKQRRAEQVRGQGGGPNNVYVSKCKNKIKFTY